QPVVLDRDISTFDIAGLAKSFAKRRRTAGRGLGQPKVHESDHRHRTLLRAGRDRPRRRAAESSDEFAPSKANAHLPLPSPMGALSRHNTTVEGCGPRARRLPRTRPGEQGRGHFGPGLLAVNPSFPAKTVPEFITYAKANPGKISMASGGVGSGNHLSGELF